MRCDSWPIDNFLVIDTKPNRSCYHDGRLLLQCGDAKIASVSQIKNIRIHSGYKTFEADSTDEAISFHKRIIEVETLKDMIDIAYGDGKKSKKLAIAHLRKTFGPPPFTSLFYILLFLTGLCFGLLL